MLDLEWYKKLGLGDVCEKVLAAERLSLEDGERLFDCPDILAVGALAHQARTRLHGKDAYYVINQHINYSNICVNGCRFCAFGREKGDPLAFQLSLYDILKKVKDRAGDPITEIHIVGGCHPDLPLAYYESVLREIKALRPDIFIKAFTAVEIAHFAGKEGITGYTHEPWHLRYLGTALAEAVYKSGLTYDEYYAREIDIPVKGTAATAIGVYIGRA